MPMPTDPRTYGKNRNLQQILHKWFGCQGSFNAKISSILEENAYFKGFGDKHGFIKNASVLDLLFNEGPNALSYLKEQPLPFLNA